jgi:CubicO group peptidase (beta-lactamase class C family)
MPEVTVEGFAQPRFAPVRDVFAANLANGADVGACFAATVEGETVVDLWGGSADEAKTRPWEKDTLVNVYSTTKTMTALTALMLADRGELDFAAPVAHYWPEFAANGKAGVKVSHLMSHSAGLSGWKQPISKQDLYDWEKVTGLLAAQAPYWEPGTASGYHALTQGYLVGEVVRRITGRTLGAVFREEIAKPLAADFHIGLPASEDSRVAELIPPPPGAAVGDGEQSELSANMSRNPGVDVMETRTRAWRAAEIPAANGHGNARSIAEIHVLLANGGAAKGRRILSEAGCRKALELQIEGQDLIFGAPARFGMGFGLPSAQMPLPHANTIYWGGYGGSLAIIDMDARTTFGYAMNKMAATTMGDMRGMGLAMGMWAALAQ